MSSIKFMLVQSSPPLQDSREIETILTYSLRSLFGECEPHSCLVQVVKTTAVNKAIIKCPEESLNAVRAALTFCHPPLYLQPTIYQFDVLQIANNESNLGV